MMPRSEPDDAALEDAYPVVIERAGANLSAYLPDLPGLVATGDDREGVIAAVRSALLLHLRALREAGEGVPEPSSPQSLGRAARDLESEGELVWLPPATPDPVSRAVAEAVRASGLSQTEVARRMGTSRSTVNRLMSPVYHGHCLQTLRRVGEAVGMRVEVVFR